MIKRHTPGPWRRDQYGSVKDSAGNPVHTRGFTTLCAGSTDAVAEAEANTDLATAAPELLEALKIITRTVFDYNNADAAYMASIAQAVIDKFSDDEGRLL